MRQYKGYEVEVISRQESTNATIKVGLLPDGKRGVLTGRILEVTEKELVNDDMNSLAQFNNWPHWEQNLLKCGGYAAYVLGDVDDPNYRKIHVLKQIDKDIKFKVETLLGYAFLYSGSIATVHIKELYPVDDPHVYAIKTEVQAINNGATFEGQVTGYEEGTNTLICLSYANKACDAKRYAYPLAKIGMTTYLDLQDEYKQEQTKRAELVHSVASAEKNLSNAEKNLSDAISYLETTKRKLREYDVKL